MKATYRLFLGSIIGVGMMFSSAQAQTWEQREAAPETAPLKAQLANAVQETGQPMGLQALMDAYTAAVNANPADAISLSVAALSLLRENVPGDNFMDNAVLLLEAGVGALAGNANPSLPNIATLIGFGVDIAGPERQVDVLKFLYNGAATKLDAAGQSALISTMNQQIVLQIPGGLDNKGVSTEDVPAGSVVTDQIGFPDAITMQLTSLNPGLEARRALASPFAFSDISVPGSGWIGGDSPVGTAGGTLADALDDGGGIGEQPPGAVPTPTPVSTPTPTPTPDPTPTPTPTPPAPTPTPSPVSPP